MLKLVPAKVQRPAPTLFSVPCPVRLPLKVELAALPTVSEIGESCTF